LCYTACEDGAHQAIGLPEDEGRIPYIIEENCVGCNLCSLVCPVENCITMVRKDDGSQSENWKDFVAAGKAPDTFNDQRAGGLGPLGAGTRYCIGKKKIRQDIMDIFLQAAIDEARKGLEEGGIPIGSVLVYRGEIIGRGHNRRVQQGSAILHGEMDALENAGRRSAEVYRECTIYTTLSPCSMCSGAILLYGIPKWSLVKTRPLWAKKRSWNPVAW
jgi:tRNA(Arg) A34 adenosine deaminase TadA/NAD-dependent dihydropyrimidine dehydrogenase PreA subunit